jgi:NADH-quinone oxidoreductase subunit C
MTLSQRIQEKFLQEIIEAHAFRGDETLIIRPGALRAVAKFLKETPELDFNFLMDLTAVDYLFFAGGRARKDQRFEVVYHFYSLKHNHRLRLKAPVNEQSLEIDTLTDLWPSADWYEREVWDMFGIKFRGHPNLKRILMYEGFQGHALRKDYPFNKRQPLIGPSID